jgi:adenine-specific DNA-methyltransferase
VSESASVDLRHPYLTRHLIAYIGNKRALLGFLAAAFRRAGEACGARAAAGEPGARGGLPGAGLTFLDPFAGSGAVSRLARLMGFRVLANDWEFYSYVLNSAHLGVEACDLPGLFRRAGGLDRMLEELNRLADPPEAERYIARHYAPADTARADYRRERLFYTAENARFIDAARNRIEALYPGFDLLPDALREKMLLLAALLYPCATHTNTSGVFKACHKGFGGHGRDALKRILSPVRLEAPVLIDAACRSQVYRMEAAEFARRFSGDIAYLDPPYNQHQYGSNYHLLNTIALWDRPPVDERRRGDGTMARKAAIRADWVLTRSEYCYRETALPAFRRLLEALDCRTLLLSYNTEGIIPFEELVDTLAERGRVEIATSEYIKYRGGKQSMGRQMHNLELLLVVERGGTDGSAARRRARELLRRRKLELLLRRSFHPERVRRAFPEAFPEDGAALVVQTPGGEVRLAMPHLYRFDGSMAGSMALPAGLTAAAMEDLSRRFAPCECRDKREEIDVLVEILRGELSIAERREYSRRVLYLLRKFAFRKYRTVFEETLRLLGELAAGEPRLFAQVGAGLAALEALARARFEG